MKENKKKWILPFLVFIIGTAILAGMADRLKVSSQKQNREMADLNAMTYAERVRTDLMKGIGVTDTLEQILVSENGKISKFSCVAENMMTNYIQSIQLAPKGIATEIYPKKGNDAGKIDLIHDKDRGEISRYARDNGVLTLQGPFELKQGGQGIAVRNPVYLENDDGEEVFWGFTIVIIRVPDIFADTVKALSDFGYDYRLSKTVSCREETYEVVYRSKGKLMDPVSYAFEMAGDHWKLEVMPRQGWFSYRSLYRFFVGGMLIVVLFTGLTAALLIFYEHRQRFRRLAVTDALTGIYNRHGFDEKVEQYLKQHSDRPCVGVQFDIDDFKLINDMFGHASGDKALQILTQTMQDYFGEPAVLGRSGGDEFCIFLPDCTCEKVKHRLEEFTESRRVFIYNGEEKEFHISLGYAEYPLQGEDYLQLMRCADAALYEVKQQGKNGCMAYQKGFRSEVRTQLGFALRDVSENLPGAFIIYRADKMDDEILFANREMIRLTGCQSMDELLTYTQGSFRNLIRQEERKTVEQDIWTQIEDGHRNDYIHFHLKKQDGSFLEVLDHGRIVENERYGKVFYVLIMDYASMKRHFKIWK
jgi:diguanylate cyclase (GGDEF)-like protein